MKKLILLIFALLVFTSIIYSQPAAQITNGNVPFIKGNEGLIGAQCVGGIVYDDNTWENGYGWNPGYGIGKWVLKFTPSSYPYKIGKICFALTGNSGADWIFDIEVYDTTGTNGRPGNLITGIVNQTAVNVPVWPAVTWFDFDQIISIPVLNSGSYYVGLSWNPSTMSGRYLAADESPTTPARLGYGYIQNTWGTIQSFFPSNRAVGIRVDTADVIYSHNIKAGPFLSIPELFTLGTQSVIKAKVTNMGTSNETGVPFKFFVNGIHLFTVNKNLNTGAVDSVSFNWTPAEAGNNNLKVVAALSNDQFRGNDTASINVTVNSQGAINSCIGTGALPAGYPFYTFYMDSKTDMLYLANEIGNDGRPAIITNIAFDVMTAAPATMSGFKIKMQNTTNTTVSGFPQTGWHIVYSSTYTVPGTGWRWITLDTPFVYNGTNLLIEVCFNNGGYSQNSTVASTTFSGKVYHKHEDLSSGDGCINITTGSTQTTRPNICLIIWNGNNRKIQSEIPKEFSLSQNYPNPFNPKTIISYQLPISNYVKLTIFDALGKNAAVLVNEKQNAGSYSVEWDGTNYSSGLYFYKLECEGFSDVKKLVLIK
ncbi:MAG: T9SS C-terminal target domain-containing protein [Ignavibacteriae bacterium]|nr:MAG: T9SS C-terminal target domain-containing protein [Ignavibacteriota bacterium]